ncbi:MAG TPA: phage head-tail connector protein [Allosphingosinicella sp.]|nr:phage head-tail connector protein [Allosphingosinicella sp.]
MGEILLSPAPLAPVSLAEVKAFLRIAASDEDALLAGLVRAAADTCEAFLGRVLIARDVAELIAASTAWTRLGAAPVRSIDGAAAIGADGSAEALPVSSYSIDIDAAGEGWVRLLEPRPGKRLRIGYSAGMAAEPNGVPEAVRQGIVRLAAHLYVHREAAEAGPPPAAVTALWRPWRRLRLG